jgi:hypothetical protein
LILLHNSAMQLSNVQLSYVPYDYAPQFFPWFWSAILPYNLTRNFTLQFCPAIRLHYFALQFQSNPLLFMLISFFKTHFISSNHLICSCNLFILFIIPIILFWPFNPRSKVTKLLKMLNFSWQLNAYFLNTLAANFITCYRP